MYMSAFILATLVLLRECKDSCMYVCEEIYLSYCLNLSSCVL